MNLCILMGKIISDIEFKFIINSKNKSIVEFEIETLDCNIVKLCAYNEIADKCYALLKRNMSIIISGELMGNGNVKIFNIGNKTIKF